MYIPISLSSTRPSHKPPFFVILLIILIIILLLLLPLLLLNQYNSTYSNTTTLQLSNSTSLPGPILFQLSTSTSYKPTKPYPPPPLLLQHAALPDPAKPYLGSCRQGPKDPRYVLTCNKLQATKHPQQHPNQPTWSTSLPSIHPYIPPSLPPLFFLLLLRVSYISCCPMVLFPQKSRKEELGLLRKVPVLRNQQHRPYRIGNDCYCRWGVLPFLSSTVLPSMVLRF